MNNRTNNAKLLKAVKAGVIALLDIPWPVIAWLMGIAGFIAGTNVGYSSAERYAERKRLQKCLDEIGDQKRSQP